MILAVCSDIHDNIWALEKALPRMARADAVLYGHDHLAHQGKAGNCHLLNPGEIMGRLGRSSFLTFDTNTGVADLVEITVR